MTFKLPPVEPDIFHKDYESRSRADIKKVGTYRYAEDESTEIFCAAIAMNDEEPRVWINPKFEVDDGMFEVRSELSDAEVLDYSQYVHVNKAEVWAHNAQFEHAITKYQGAQHGFFVEDDRWRCTAALARRAAIPASLAQAAATLGLTQQKDKGGSSLITKFCIPNKKTGKFLEPQQDPAAFRRFIEYCRQDVRVERGTHKELKAFSLSGAVLDSFLLDLRVNSRGLQVNMDALHHVQKLIQTQEDELAAEFKDLTGFGHAQQKVFMVWLKEQGYKGDNIRASTMDEEFDDDDFDPHSALGRALVIRKKLSFASIKKVKAMIRCACSDGAARGTLQYHGAGTGRSSGRLIQPQNFKRPTIKTTDAAYADICDHYSAVHLELCYGPLLETISSCIRHFIQPHEGVLLDCDFSAIEARILAWLANEVWKLKIFRGDGMIYEETGARLAQVDVSVLHEYRESHGGKEHHPARFRGKVAELALGYQGAVGALIKMGALDMGLTEEELPDIVKAWRKLHPNVVKFWYACEKAAKLAIGSPNIKFPVGKVVFFTALAAGAKYMFIRLPSGRRIAYRDPKIMLERVKAEEDDDSDDGWGEDEKPKVKFREYITYWGQLDGKAIWGDVRTYAGSLVENICQGIAADLLSSGMIKAEARGIQIATLIHDQALAYCKDPAQAPALLTVLEESMTDLPPWAAGLPVAVEGKITKYYKK